MHTYIVTELIPLYFVSIFLPLYFQKIYYILGKKYILIFFF